MAFKLKKTSDNLFHKVSESKLDGGKVTQQPQVNMEAPSSPAKFDPITIGSSVYSLGKLAMGAAKKGAQMYSDYTSGKSAREKSESVKPKPTPEPTGADKLQAIAPDKPKPAKADKYSNAAKKDSKLGEYVAKRKTLKKGSAEWNANQNKINKAYGVKKRYNEAPASKVKPEAKTVTKPQAEAEVKKQPKDPKSITSKNVTVKSNKQERSEKRVEKLQNKASEDGSLSKGQRRKLARNEQKAAGEKVDYKNRSFLGKLVRKDPSKKKNKKQGKSKSAAPDFSGMS